MLYNQAIAPEFPRSWSNSLKVGEEMDVAMEVIVMFLKVNDVEGLTHLARAIVLGRWGVGAGGALYPP